MRQARDCATGSPQRAGNKSSGGIALWFRKAVNTGISPAHAAAIFDLSLNDVVVAGWLPESVTTMFPQQQAFYPYFAPSYPQPYSQYSITAGGSSPSMQIPANAHGHQGTQPMGQYQMAQNATPYVPYTYVQHAPPYVYPPETTDETVNTMEPRNECA